MIYSTAASDGDSETAAVDVDVGDRVKVGLHMSTYASIAHHI
jgi:hypothetical protein